MHVIHHRPTVSENYSDLTKSFKCNVNDFEILLRFIFNMFESWYLIFY